METVPTLERELQGQRQFDGVGVDTESPEIYDLLDTPCSSTATVVSRQGGGESSTCITVFGKYRVFVEEGEDIEEVYNNFHIATQESISDGILEESLQEVVAELNTTVSFVVEGVSTEVDEEFDAFVEIVTDEPPLSNTTMAPVLSNTAVAPETNETEKENEKSGSCRSYSSVVATLLTVLAAINFC